MNPSVPRFPALVQFRRARWDWHLTLILGLAFIAWLLSSPERTPIVRNFGVAFLGAFNFVVAARFWQASGRGGLPDGVRRALKYFSAGVAMTGVGATYLLLERWIGGDFGKKFSLADPLFLANYPLILAGLFHLPKGERPAAGRWRIAVDGAACVAGVGVPLWLGAVGTAWRQATGTDALLEVVWPAAAFLGLVALNAILLTRRPWPSRGAFWLLLSGFGVSWMADLIFSLDASAFVIRSSTITWTNVANAASLCLSLGAAWRFGSDPLDDQPRLRPAAFSPVPMVTMIVVAAWLVALAAASPADPHLLRKMIPGMILLLFVLFVREILVLRDTARWMAVDFQRESQARIEAIVRHSSDVLMVVDGSGVILFGSPSLVVALGLPMDELVGSSLLQFVDPEDAPAAARFLTELRMQPGGVSGLHWRLRHADGTARHFETAGSNALSEPAIGGLVLNSRDVTDRTLLEHELRQSHKLEAIGRLVGGIAHNLNNILGAMLLQVGLLRDRRELPAILLGEIAGLEQGAKRAAELIQQLQAFSQVQSLRLKRFNLVETLADIQPVLCRLVGGPTELVITGDNRPKWVEADGALVNQVIFNLCANARDAMPSGGRLTIEITRVEVGTGDGAPRAGTFVCLAFQDTGRGMDDRVRQRLFEPFFTTKDVGKGLGLGLAAVHGIVKQHGGYISVDSEVGRGSIFRVFLPAAE